MSKFVVSIDPSITSTGITLWGNQIPPVMLEVALIKPDRRCQADADRATNIASQVEYFVVSKLAPANTIVLVEVPGAFSYKRSTSQYGYPLNIAALMKLMRVIGAIESRLDAYQIVEITPAMWKGRTSKSVTQAFTSTAYGVSQSDIADSVGMALWWMRWSLKPVRMPQKPNK